MSLRALTVSRSGFVLTIFARSIAVSLSRSYAQRGDARSNCSLLVIFFLQTSGEWYGRTVCGSFHCTLLLINTPSPSSEVCFCWFHCFCLCHFAGAPHRLVCCSMLCRSPLGVFLLSSVSDSIRRFSFHSQWWFISGRVVSLTRSVKSLLFPHILTDPLVPKRGDQ